MISRFVLFSPFDSSDPPSARHKALFSCSPGAKARRATGFLAQLVCCPSRETPCRPCTSPAHLDIDKRHAARVVAPVGVRTRPGCRDRVILMSGVSNLQYDIFRICSLRLGWERGCSLPKTICGHVGFVKPLNWGGQAKSIRADTLQRSVCQQRPEVWYIAKAKGNV